jgi:zinc protease
MRRAHLIPALSLCAALLMACVSAPRSTQTAEALLDPHKLPPPPPLQFTTPQVERIVMPNGLIVYLLEDHELPLLEVRTITRVGSIYDPPDKVGLAGIAGTVMRTGGTSTMTGDELDDELEFMAASIETGIGGEMGTASLSCLSKDSERGIELLSQVLRDPAFRQEKIDLALNQEREDIRRRNDDPREITRREFRWLLYGKDNPWVRLSSMDTLSNITRDDLVALHARHYRPNNTMLGVAGDFNRDEMMAMLQRHFGDWQRADVEIPPPPGVPDTVNAGVYFIDRPEVNQSNIRMGHWGIQRHNPDEFSVKVMNFIYGMSGFSSLLMREVRSNRGLTYGIFGLLGEGTVRGQFVVGTFTKSETTGQTIDVIRDVTRSFQESPPTQKQLDLAQDSEANSFVFRFDSPIKIVGERMNLEFYGYPDDYLDTYLDKVRAVTTADVQRVADQYIHPNDMIILVVGNAQQIGDQLQHLGTVHQVPLIDFATGQQIWP